MKTTHLNQRSFLSTLTLATVTGGACLSGLAARAAEATAEKPKVIGLLFYADWCGTCKVLDPRLTAVKQQFRGKPVLFTRVDETDDFTKHQSRLHMALLDLNKIYAAEGGKTGFLLLIDPATGKVRERITRQHEEPQILAAIQKALG